MDRESKIVFLIPNRSESRPKNGCEKNWAYCSSKYSYYINDIISYNLYEFILKRLFKIKSIIEAASYAIDGSNPNDFIVQKMCSQGWYH